ncbi:DUF6069 family protein [Plantactinospora sp. GCM10030261]|uniref:DUF6069 family protein n=1 Tax=Plantactinospora sp. GCM10030261 TaxID=3273420 RepID=UPI0036176214
MNSSAGMRRRQIRGAAVIAAILAALLVWAGARLAGAHLRVQPDGAAPMVVGPGIVAAFAAQAALLGWLSLAVLERLTPRHAAIAWGILAGIVLLVSFVPVLTVTASGGTRLALGLMHIAVAAVLVPPLLRTSSHATQSRMATAPA